MKHSVTLLLFIFGFTFSGFATQIYGNTFQPFEGKTVNLIEYTDYVTLNYRIIQSTTIDSNGNFFFDYAITETQQAIIQIEYLIGIIYLDPNQVYSIKFPPKSEDGTYKLTRNNVNLIFDSIPLGDINGLVLEFDRLYDQFLQDNRYYAGKKIFHSKLDTFKIKVQQQFQGVKNSYFKNYVRFSIADLELVTPSSHLKVNKLGLYNSHIINKRVNTKHHAQMRFLLNFYEKTLNNQLGKVGAKIAKVLNENPSYIALDTLLKKDYFFSMNSIRELVITENLYSLYYDPNYSPIEILGLLQEAERLGEDEEVKKITREIIKNITKLVPGATPPPFTFVNQNKELVSIEDFKGNYVYINFWAKWNKGSQAEMDVFMRLKKEYGDFVELVSINIDASYKKYELFCATHPQYDWNMLYYGGNSNLLDEFNIFAIPHYILLDKAGKILQAPAAKPVPNGQNKSIELLFFEIKKKETQPRRFNIGTK